MLSTFREDREESGQGSNSGPYHSFAFSITEAPGCNSSGRNVGRKMSVDRRRKLSHPASLQPSSALLGVGQGQAPAKRRFSHVSDAVSRRLSTTIGWRSSGVATADIVAQGKTLCGQYIRCRLKRSNAFNKKCGLQRLRSVVHLPVVREVFPELLSLGQELERLHPSLYTGVGRQAGSSAVLTGDTAAGALLTGVARELARSPLTWAKVVSLYAVAGGLASDCVRQGHPEYLQPLVEAMGEALDYHMADWISHNGGWAGILTYGKPSTPDIPLSGFAALLATAMAALAVLVAILRWFGR